MRFSTILVVFAVEDADLGRVMDGLIEFVLDFLTGSAFERADEVDGGQGEEEARYDFIEAEPVELLPNEDCQTADDDAGQGPILVIFFQYRERRIVGPKAAPKPAQA